jgi:pantothenate kinase type III
MLLTIDIGNTNLTPELFEGQKMYARFSQKDQVSEEVIKQVQK